MNERATPRTDAKADYWLEPGMRAEYEITPADFTRELERELAEAREETLEQARLLGMSGQREAKLLSELAEAQETISDVRSALGAMDHEGARLAALRVREDIAKAKDQLKMHQDAYAENRRVIAKAMDDPPSPQWIAIDLIVRELAEAKYIAQYWRNASECTCDSGRPIGACLRCDMERIARNPTAPTHADELQRQLAKAKDQRDRLATLAGELIAMIRVNVMRNTFSSVTFDQMEQHLAPWIARLRELDR